MYVELELTQGPSSGWADFTYDWTGELMRRSNSGTGTQEWRLPQAVPSEWEIVGMAVLARAGTWPVHNLAYPIVVDTYARLELALGAPGALGPRKLQSVLGNPAPVQVGDANDLWGLGPLTGWHLNAAGWGLTVRRPADPDEETSQPRLIGSVRLGLWFNVSAENSMAERATVTQKVFVGRESPKGTAATNYRRLVSLKAEPKHAGEIKALRDSGTKLPYDHLLMSEHSTFALSGEPTYNETPVALRTLLSPVGSGNIPGSGTAYRHTFALDPFAEDNVDSLSLIFGDDVRAHRTLYNQLAELTMDFNRNDMGLSGSGFGRAIEDSVPIPTGVNEVQTVTFAGSPTGGTFRLAFEGQETSDLQVIQGGAPITASALQTALNAVPTIGSGGVSVSGALTGTTSVTGGALTVTFNGSRFAGRNVGALQKAKVQLTGGSSPDVALAETARGGWTEMLPIPIRPGAVQTGGGVNIYAASSYAALTSGKMTRVHVSQIKIAGKVAPYWVMDDDQRSTLGLIERPSTVEFRVTAQANSEAMAWLQDLRNGANKFVRLEAKTPSGVTIDGTNPYRMLFESAAKVSSTFDFKDDQSVYATEFTVSCRFDPSTGLRPTFVFDNEVQSY